MPVSCRRAFGVLTLLTLSLVFFASVARAETWAEKLGYPAGKRVMILHADDIGMCYEANYRGQGLSARPATSRSAALMVPCPWYNEIADWYKQNPDYDLGLHLAMNSEWKWYRWGPVGRSRDKCPAWSTRKASCGAASSRPHATPSPSEVENEIRAQVERAISKGTRPGHIDTHMGTLFVRIDFTKAYLKVAEEYRIPAMVIEQTPEVIAKFRKQGYPITDESLKVIAEYKLPKLDDFHSVLEGKTYEEK